MTPKQTATLLGLALTWGASFLFIRVLVDGGVGAAGVGAGRCTLGILALLPVLVLSKTKVRLARRTVAAILLVGIVNMATPWTLFAVAEQHVPSGVASVGNSTTPLWAAILSTLLLRSERLGRAQVAGLFVGFAGIVVLSIDGLNGFDREALAGTGLISIATLCYGISAVSIRRWLGHVPAVPLTVGQLLVSAAVLWPLALATGAFEGADMGAREWGSILTLGAVGSGLAGAGYMWLIGQVGAVRASVVTYLLPPTGVLLGWLLLDETVGWNLLAGLGFVVAGVALVQGWAVRWFAALLASPGRTVAVAEADAD